MIDPNAPAYPNHDFYQVGDVSTRTTLSGGLTIRAEIASRVLAGVLANPQSAKNLVVAANKLDKDIFQLAAEDAVRMADALIAELNKGGV